MAGKVLPYNRSVVFKLLVESADTISRLPVVKGSMGIRVTEGMEYVVSDAVVSTVPLEVTNIVGGISIVSTQNFNVALTLGGVECPPVKCAGLFVFTGPIDKLVVSQAAAGTPIRLKYVKA